MREPCPVVLSPRASGHVDLIDAWWRIWRPAAPELFAVELSAGLERLAAAPMIGLVCAGPGRLPLRRMLLRQTRYNIYYMVRPRLHRVDVVAVWHASRGKGPFSPG